MVKKLLSAAILLGVACQAIVGIDDKQLDPKYGSGADGQAGKPGSDPRPPSRPSGPATPGGGPTRWFAVRTIFLGTYDPDTKQKSLEAWKKIGHDIDGECTTPEISKSNSSATCKKPPSAS